MAHIDANFGYKVGKTYLMVTRLFFKVQPKMTLIRPADLADV